MKKIGVILFLTIAGYTAGAQKVIPVIDPGTSFSYTLLLHGQHVPFTIIVKSMTDTLVLKWSIRGLAGGTYKIIPAAFKNGSKMNFVQPVANVTVTLPSDQTFMMISKNAFKDLSEKRRFEYDNTIYVLKGDTTESPVTPGGKPLDVLHVVALNETTQFWILNSPDFPFICKIAGNPLGIDADLDRVSSLSSAK